MGKKRSSALKQKCSLELFAKQNLSEYSFEWTGSGDIDNTGKIKLGTTENEVKYQVTVKKADNLVLSKAFTTKIN